MVADLQDVITQTRNEAASSRVERNVVRWAITPTTIASDEPTSSYAGPPPLKRADRDRWPCLILIQKNPLPFESGFFLVQS